MDDNILQHKTLEQRRAFAWSPDGKILTSVTNTKDGVDVDNWLYPNGEDSQEDEISYLSTSHKGLEGQLHTYTSRVALGISPDSRLLAAGGGTKKEGIIHVFDVQSNTHLFTSQALSSNVCELKFTQCGRFLVTGEGNGTVTLWELATEGAPGLQLIDKMLFDGRVLALGLDQLEDGIFVASKSKREGGVRISQIIFPKEVA
jgi:WD40 repeat protein